MFTKFAFLAALLFGVDHSSHAQDLEFLSPQQCPAGVHLPYQPVGVVDDQFFSLDPTMRHPRTMELVGGRLTAWSLTTFDQLFQKDLDLPREGSDWFKVHAISCGRDGFRVFYEYQGTAAKWSVIAMTNLTAAGRSTGEPQILAKLENSESHGLRIRSDVDEDSGTTVLIFGTDGMNGLRPDVRVMTITHAGVVVLDQQVALGEDATWRIDALCTDSAGSAYVAASRSGGTGAISCSMPFVIVNARTKSVEQHCLAESLDQYCGFSSMEGLGFRRRTDGLRYFIRPLYEPGNLVLTPRAVRVTTFRTEEAEFLSDQAYPIPGDDPAIENDPDQQKMWKGCRAFGASYDTTGMVRLHGVDSQHNDKAHAVLTTTFNLRIGTVHTDRCEWERRYASLIAGWYPSCESMHLVVFDGQDYIFTNEFLSNIGKVCSSLEDWPSTGPGWQGKGSTAVYASLNGNMSFRRIDFPLTIREKVPMRVRPFITRPTWAILLAEDEINSRFILARSAH